VRKISLCRSSNFLTNDFNLITFYGIFNRRVFRDKTLILFKSNRENLFVAKEVEKGIEKKKVGLIFSWYFIWVNLKVVFFDKKLKICNKKRKFTPNVYKI